MKILNLKFKNLNSLAGEWLIDFNDPQYLNDGIFAIAGANGAGKSTIMDAICLALYGQTPRLGKITQASNEIMTLGTGDCYASVEFLTKDGIYRTKWSQHRSGLKPNGRLQQQRIEVIDIEKNIVLTRINREAETLINQLTGMDFNRFTQSMMLAQGNFAQFLRASSRDRSPILEEITGTQIYGEISRMAFQRSREEKDILDKLKEKLNLISFLSEDERTTLQTKIQLKETELNELKSNLENVSKQINWIESIENLEKELDKLQKDAEIIKADNANFKEDEQRLEKGEAALLLDGSYKVMDSKNKAQQELLTQKKVSEILLPELIKSESSSKLEFAESEEMVMTSQKNYDDLCKLLIEVRRVDIEIDSMCKNIDQLTTEYLDSTEKLNQNQTNISALETELEELQTSKSGAEKYLNDNKGDDAIHSRINEIDLLFSNIENANKEVTKLNEENDNLQKEIGLKVLEKTLAVNNIKSLESEKLIQRNQHDELKIKVDTLKDGSKIEDLKEKLRLLNDQRVLLSKIQSLEEHRKVLEDGQPCPLCGSNEHPYAKGNVPENSKLELQINILQNTIRDIDRLNEEISAYQTTISNFDIQIGEINQSILLFDAGIKAINDTIVKNKIAINEMLVQQNEVFNSIAEILHNFGIREFSLELKNDIISQLKQRISLWNTNTQVVSNIDNKILEKQNLISQLNMLKTTLNEQIENLNKRLNDLMKSKMQKQQERSDLFDTKVPDVEEELARTAYQNALINKDQKSANLQTATTALNHCIAEIERLKNEIETGQSQLNQLKEDFNDKLGKSIFVNVDEFISSIISTDEINILKNRREELKNLSTANAALLKRTGENLMVEKAKDLTQSDKSSLNEEKSRLTVLDQSLRDEIAVWKNTLLNDIENQIKMGDIKKEIDAQILISDKWLKLNEYIGSADGEKFRTFAQGLTFEMMLNYSNIQLCKLTDRYLMKRDDSEPLKLNVVDIYQGNTERSTDNLCGGESFLFSLALALGLSHMSSKNVKIETLFLDEGFGTLDEDNLEIALNALNSLQQEGKLIGVISHVSPLKDNINTQIKIEKGPQGRSMIYGPGCARLS